jgi:hypothetical protein
MKGLPEVWKPSRFTGVSVSSWGRVMVEPYESAMPYGGIRTYGGVPTYGVWDEESRRFLYKYKGRTYKVHILVCEAFNGAKPFPKAVVMHDDEDSSNNVPSNLKWGTQKENLNYPGFKAIVAQRNRDRALARIQIAA